MILPLVIKTRNEVQCNISGLTIADKNLIYKKLGVFIPNARFMPKYKLGIWDGCIHYFDQNGNLPTGLLQEAFKLIDLRQYAPSVIQYPSFTPRPQFQPIDENVFADYCWEKGHRLQGQPITLEEHQVRGVNALLAAGKGVIEYGTGAGKTIMTAALCKRVCPVGKMVVIVPSRDLVKNTADQLIALGFDCGSVLNDGTREDNYRKEVVVITWQSILSINRRIKGKGYWYDQIKEAETQATKCLRMHKMDELALIKVKIKELEKNSAEDQMKAKAELQALQDGIVAFLFDETHTAKGSEIKTILSETFPFVQVRFGMTGTVPKDLGDRYCVFAGIGGGVVETMSAHDLQELGFLADSEVKIVQLDDKPRFADYQSEVSYVSSYTPRLEWIGKYALQTANQMGNTLMLVNHIETGEKLETIIRANGGEVTFLSGKDSVKTRDAQYKRVNNENHALIIATAQIASTGINMPRLKNLIFLDSGKSFVRTIQSIGRGLRLGRDKTKVVVHDISSALKWQKQHLTKRKAYYKDAKIPMTERKVKDWEQ